MNNPTWHAALALALAFPSAAWAQSSGVTDLGALNGGSFSVAFVVSADGAVVVGGAADGSLGNTYRAFRWTQAGGLQSLGTLNGGTDSVSVGISANGSVIVGTTADGAAGDMGRAFRWTQAGGLQSLGTLNGGDFSSANGVSADGTAVVGEANDGSAGNARRAFRWTQPDGMVNLGTLNGGLTSIARATNADGTVVVGDSDDGSAGNASRAFRWTQASGLVSLGTLNNGTDSVARGVSTDGTVVVGNSNDGSAGNATRAFRWTQASGMVSLGTLNGGSSSTAYGASGDGKVVVGQARDGVAGNVRRAFRWTQAGGMQSVDAWLRANGVAVPGDITEEAKATNQDGSVVVGTLANDYAFIARVSAAGNGLVTLADVQTSLDAAAAGGSMALSSANTTLNGAHSRPLQRRVGTGQKTFWLAGDWGRDDHGQRDGDLGLAEVGGGWNLDAMQINVSAGQTWARQNLALGGRAAIDGNYLLAEALIPVANGLWATFGGYGHWGQADLKRGYLNAGVKTASKASPDVNTWGLRARLDWENAATLAGIGVTPYADLSYARSRLDGYTETGGGFPARFDARTEKSTELRLGVNAAKPVGSGLTLVGTLEAAHRFEKDGAHTSGQVIGLFGFDLAGQTYKRDWLRFGAGVEGKVGGGTGSLSLNATTRGEALSTWLAANWQMAF